MIPLTNDAEEVVDVRPLVHRETHWMTVDHYLNKLFDEI